MAGVSARRWSKKMTEPSARRRGRWGGDRCWQLLNSLLHFLQEEIIEHLLERQEGHHMCEDGANMLEVLVQPAQDIVIPHSEIAGTKPPSCAQDVSFTRTVTI
jgi:hypothetical protein